MGELVPIVAAGAFFWCIVAVTRTLADRSFKLKLIDAAPPTEMMRMLLSTPRPGPELGSLKWGIVGVAVGTALLIVHLTEMTDSDAMTAGVLVLAGGIGLLVYYGIATRILRNAPRSDDREA
jgi:hypothetical protein